MDLALVIGRLRAESKNLRSKLTNLSVMIAEGARLRGAASRAGDVVPTGWKWDAGTAGKGINEKYAQSGPAKKVDILPRS